MTESSIPVITIDGPAGSGKSTTAKLLAEKLKFIYLDTGAMYRAITYYFLEHSINLKNPEEVNQALLNINLSIYFNNEFEVHINGKNINNKIRSTEVNDFVSSVSKIDSVRKRMVKTQRLFSENRNIVIEGRDIGSYVFPDAEFKFFLVADVFERAKRRLKEIKDDSSITINSLVKKLNKRDEIDSSRTISPLLKAQDAIEIDTTSLTVDEQVKELYNIINK